MKGYDYSATTASGAVLSTTSTLFLGNSTTSAQQSDLSKSFHKSVKLTPHKTSIWRTIVDRLFVINQTSRGEPLRDKVLIFINLTLIFGGLIWLSIYTVIPFSLRINPLLNFLGGAIIGTSAIWGRWWITILLGIVVFYGLFKLYKMTMKQILLAVFLFFAIPTAIMLIILLEYLIASSL